METLFNAQNRAELIERSCQAPVVFHNHPLPFGCRPTHADISLESTLSGETGQYQALLRVDQGVVYEGNDLSVSRWIESGTRVFQLCGTPAHPRPDECVDWLRRSLLKGTPGEFCCNCGDYVPYSVSLRGGSLRKKFVCPTCKKKRQPMPPRGGAHGWNKLCLDCNEVSDVTLQVSDECNYCPKCGGAPVVNLWDAARFVRAHISELRMSEEIPPWVFH